VVHRFTAFISANNASKSDKKDAVVFKFLCLGEKIRRKGGVQKGLPLRKISPQEVPL